MTIHIRGLRVRGRHGVLASERELGQPFVLDIAMEVSDLRASASDDLAHTVDYAAVADGVAAVVAGAPVDLIERLAQMVADRVLEDDRVDAVTVTVAKPHAPVGQLVDDVAVTLRVERDAP